MNTYLENVEEVEKINKVREILENYEIQGILRKNSYSMYLVRRDQHIKTAEDYEVIYMPTRIIGTCARGIIAEESYEPAHISGWFYNGRYLYKDYKIIVTLYMNDDLYVVNQIDLLTLEEDRSQIKM